MRYINSRDFKIEEGTVVTFGKFDGIHRGHRLLVEKAREIADQYGLKVVLCTFDMYDWFKEKGIDNGGQITTTEERKIVCRSMGIDVLVEYPFDDNVASTKPETFISEIIKSKLNSSYVVVGNDWHFACNREGNADVLKAFETKYDYKAFVIDKLIDEDREISSTWIREEIKKGNMEKTEELLGYSYIVCGKVLHGNRIGRTIGFPTVNLYPPQDKLLPPYGVYASKVRCNGKEYYGVTNVGVKPTVTDDNKITVETYVIGLNEDVYDEYIEVDLCHFVRPEVKFNSLDELKNQLSKDISNTKKYFAEDT